MANGLPGYTSERREAFFEKDWPIVKASVDLFLRTLPSGGAPPEHLVRPMIEKMVKIIVILSDIIDDDQAEILALKTVHKAMERKNGPTV
jgi:hypothetical protein